MLETPAFSTRRVAERFEAALAHIRANGSREALAACVETAALYDRPEMELFDPARWLKEHAAGFTALGFYVHIEPIGEEHAGDPRKMMTCLQALGGAVAARKQGRIAIELHEEIERGTRIPVLLVETASAHGIPHAVRFGGCYSMTLDELGLCWTLASSGGRIDRKGNTLALRLKGMRLPAKPLPLARTLLEALGPAPDAAALNAALDVLDSETRREPADLSVIVRDVFAERAEELEAGGIAVETSFPENLPPIAVRRSRLTAFVSILCDGALDTAPHGGKLSLQGEYNANEREASVLLTLAPSEGALCANIQTAALERIAGQLDAAFERIADEDECLMTLTLPDTVGRAVDEWIPGWESFGERPRKMLRLVKSGGQTPPAELILDGALEEELERWLLPRLDAPAAVNIAHEIKPYSAGLEGSHPERLRKVLEQIARGKPKKEICRPQYAGEIIWAFSQTERQRVLLEIAGMSPETVRALCAALLSAPPAYVEALRILAARGKI